MANVKFIKIGKESTKVIESYNDGAVYFDEKNQLIILGNGTATPAINMKVSDASYVNDKLTIVVSGKPITLDFSDIASASEIEKRLKALEAKAPVAGHDVKIGKLSDDDDVADNAISVALSSDIVVAGGPLADDILNDWPSDWKNSDDAKIIPAGKTLKQILEGLFLKPIDGTVSFSYSAWNPVLGNPTAKLSSTAVQEVNASITPTAGGNSTVTGNSVTATGKATQGYFLTTDGA